MNRDLDAALHDLAQHAAAAHRSRRVDGTGVSTAAVTHRVRRHRRVRAGLTAATALVAVAGVVLAGTALADRRDPLPADSPTVAPSPSVTTPAPSETTPVVVLPAGDPSLPFGECGSLVVAPTDPVTDPTADVTITSTPAVLGGQPIEVSASLAPPQGATRGFHRDSGPRVVITHEGVVVATIDAYPRSEEPDVFLRASSVEFANTIATTVTHQVPVVCADEAGTGTSGAALPAGDYQVLAVDEIWWADTDPETVEWPTGLTVTALAEATGAVHATAVGDPVPLSISGEQVDPSAVPAAPTGTPVAPQGADAFSQVCTPPDLGTTIPGFTTGGSGDPVRLAPGGTLTFSMSVAYQGPGRARWATLAPSLAIVQDGAVVAVVEGIDDRTVDGDQGTVQTRASEGSGALRCQDGWPVDAVSLEPGTYQAIPWTTIWVDRLTGSDGIAVPVPSGDDYVGDPITGTPFTLVVE